MKKKFHTLFNGELSDAPGRCESWTESVRYLGAGRWELVAHSSNFSGTGPAETHVERMGTAALVRWVLERGDEEHETDQNKASRKKTTTNEGGKESAIARTLGEHAARLLAIAKREKAKYCVACLQGWLDGKWPPVKKQAIPRIVTVNGVTRRQIWRGVYHAVYDVETSSGPGYLYPPRADNEAWLVVKTDSSMNAGFNVRLSKAVLAKVAELKKALALLPSH